ncbi:MAG TPA: GNAT family N-acetyltransferase [Steroidobacteraceae bacterium]|jgi:RimJ/RimL family protein N-acetyltransferase|nr:GNAT family N-acetyltransferase [Steroidobacteraceae bacterium]
MVFELQPHLQNDLIKLEPLEAGDFERLYAVASDPLIWEQHPSSDRYQRPVFENFFKGAMESRGAFRVIDNTNRELIGSSRYSDYDEAQRQISIGYTFIARSRWARRYNPALKTLMLDHAFKFVDRVTFKVGINNWRSRKAMEKLGGIYIGEESVSYSGEPSHPNVVFKIDAKDWADRPR